MGKARQNPKRRVSTPTPSKAQSVSEAASAVVAATLQVPVVASESTPVAPVPSTTVPAVPAPVVNAVPAVQSVDEDMETEDALLNGRPVPSTNSPAQEPSGVQEPPTTESETETTTPSDPPSVEVVNTTVSSGSTAPKSLNSSKNSNTSGFSTGSDSKLDLETDSFDEIPGMFASVSMISEKVKSDYPITARPPSEVTMGMVSTNGNCNDRFGSVNNDN